jgi:hypothetical protein
MKKLLVAGFLLLVAGSIPPLNGLSRFFERAKGMFSNFHFQISKITYYQSNYSVLITNY